MVKFGKKFFFNATYVKKNKTILVVICLTLITLVVATMLITKYTSFDKNENLKKDAIVYENIDIKLFGKIPYSIQYFKSIENVKLSDIKITYPDDFKLQEDLSSCSEEEKKKIEEIRNSNTPNEAKDNSFNCISYIATEVGRYNVAIELYDKKYNVNLNVVDDEAPILEVKNHEIYEDEHYNINDFVNSCTDNSQTDCTYEYLNTSLVSYDKYTEPGTYDIKLIAKDRSGNKSEAKVATLTIKKIIYYTVNYDTGGGSSVNSEQVREGRTPSYPQAPIKSGYYFKGWYLNNSEYKFDKPVTSNITITAKWEKIPTPNNPSSNPSSNPRDNIVTPPKNNNSSCIKYSEFYGSISIYNYAFAGGSKNDCMPTNSSAYKDSAVSIAERYQDSVTKRFKSDYSISTGCSVNSYYNVKSVTYNGKRSVGFLITYSLTADNCSTLADATYMLTCSSPNNCSITYN